MSQLHRRFTVLFPGLAAVGIALLVSSCGSSNGTATSTSTSIPRPTAQPASTDETASTDAALTDPLGALIIPDVPTGFSLQDEGFVGTGPTDIDKAAADAAFDGAKKFLEDIGFEREYQRLWTTNDFGSTIFIRIAGFETASGAQRYCSRIAEIMRSKAPAPEAFVVDGVPGALGVRGIDRDGSASAVFATKERRCVEVLWGGTNDVPSAEQIGNVTELFKRQYAAV